MKSFVYWLMGEQAGKATVNSWNWLVGAPPDSSSPPTNSLEVAEAALEPLKASVQKLSQAVSTQRAAYARIKQKSEAKQRELEKLEQEAAIAQDRGDESTARLTMARMIQLEEVLPQFQEQTYRAQEYLRMFQEKLSQEQIKLEAYEANLTNLKDMQDVNEA
ncbi:MAG: PspA/IM30 family protein, partial [Oscillatoriales cyanobacterium SM2_3_0]|nr:PspA/IM30 family protein [Oscillatoriales cyanobacterium SM2_3_0]